MFFSPAPKLSVCRFNIFFSALFPISPFLRPSRLAHFLKAFTGPHQFPHQSLSSCQVAPLTLCPQMSRPLVAGTPFLISSPAQPTCVCFKQVQALPDRTWFQDSSIGLSRVLLSGWSRHFFVRNNLDLFFTSQILSLSFTFGTKFYQALKPGFIQ